MVRVDGKIVFASAWEGDESVILGDIWNSSSADSKKYWMGNQTATVGDWVTLEPGVPLDMEVIMTDNGGQACLMLALMTNLLADYFHEVPESTWNQLAATATLKDKVIADLIERDDRPKRKAKAEKVLTAFRVSIRQCTGQERKAAA